MPADSIAEAVNALMNIVQLAILAGILKWLNNGQPPNRPSDRG